MTHIDDDDLVLHYYKESADPPAADAHLAGCASCRARFESLAADMTVLGDMEVPARGDWYGATVWARVAPHLDAARPRRWWTRPLPAWSGLAVAGVVATLLIAAFVAGRQSRPEPVPVGAGVVAASVPAPDAVSEQILLAAVGDCLSRSRVVLSEISNRGDGGPADISVEQATAEDLVAASRLYRQTAASRGDHAIVIVLEQLERTLVEIANAPSDASPADLLRLRDRIESQSLLFTVTVLNSQVQQRQREAARARVSTTGAST